MRTQSTWLVVAWLFIPTAMSGGSTVQVKPTESLSMLREKLANDTTITEVIFEEGVYFGSLYVSGPKDANFSQCPLLIRAADGARVIFNGSRRLEKCRPHEKLPGVFCMDYTHRGGEYPKLWEPGTRMRYSLVADSQAVARFPATYAVEGNRLLFRTSDGQLPRGGDLLISAHDFGMFIYRPYVTVRAIAFEDYLVREKWSTAIDLRVDHIAIEDCSARNCSLGFIITGDHNVVHRCTSEDVGGGVYVGGENARVEDCRLFKKRDSFMVPMYAQDDTGIQFYSPACGGLIRGNLCVGFGMGVFLKASNAPYVVEHNTLVGLGQGLGFGATSWHPKQRFRYNIIAECARQVEIPKAKKGQPQDVNHNCYWSSSRSDLRPIGANDIVADPKFVRPEWSEYRLSTDSPCLKLASATGPCGAFPAIGDATPDLGPAREWHVNETGRDAADGTATQPVRTIQCAVDRAKPGDTIIIHPGIYPDSVRITRGGTEDRPITIRAAKRWQAILDSNRSVSQMISIEKAPFIEIHDVEIRWYESVAIRIEQSPHVTVAGCRIWNAHWYGAWPTGTGLRIVRSPGFTGRHNVLFKQENAFWFYNSPNATLISNTCAANLYSAAAFLYSCENSVCRNNSFAFQGNDVIVIEENLGQKPKLKTFDCDYNNYGTALRVQPEGISFDNVMPRQQESYLNHGSKAIVNYNEYRGEMKRFVNMAEWREFSGLDRHTIFADPLFVNTAARDFRIDPNSPNRGAGADGVTIGALGMYQ